jgi:ATP-dependent helicase Lhr and Lhr-like helicase
LETTLPHSESELGQPGAFTLLHRDIQEQLYRMEWTELRPVQAMAIKVILRRECDAIITAPTAGGKTEAAFLPILSRMLESQRSGLRAMYVGPLKALINDQFRRLDLICDQLEIPVYRWHGDVSAAQKKKLLEQPSGVLLITPESTESILLNHSSILPSLFSGLDFIVIDELHSFFGNERGAQLRSQIRRIERHCTVRPRIVALSATLGDMRLAAEWLKPGDGDAVEIVQDLGAGREIKLGVRAYQDTDQREIGVVPEDEELDYRLVSDLFKHFHGKKALVFGNQKARIELYADAVKSEAQRRGVADNFLVHHGSLGRLEREDAEDELRSDRKVAVFCSSTLELGIDIGPVEVVGQMGSPPSTNALLQRLGRSGRREGQAAVMRLYCEVRDRKDLPLLDRLHLELLQTCALCTLAASGWCEPPRPQDLHLSTLVHQVMATIAERGGSKANALFNSLVVDGAFPGLSEAQFASLLRSMAKHELIEQDRSGLLILGRKGEVMARHYDFYSVFQTPVGFDVRHEHRTIGSVNYVPGPNDPEFILLSGKRWQIVSVDSEAKVIQVVPSRGKRAPTFRSRASFEVDDKVVKEMRTILVSNDTLSFCDDYANRYLNQARNLARQANLLNQSLVQENQKLYWFTWRGSRATRTLFLILAMHGYEARAENSGVIGIDQCTADMLFPVMQAVAKKLPSLEGLAEHQGVGCVEKYDEFLPVELWRYQFARNSLDLTGATEAIAELLESGR